MENKPMSKPKTPQEKAIRYFKRANIHTPLRPDGSIDYEILWSECFVEGRPMKNVMKHYDNLPAELKREN